MSVCLSRSRAIEMAKQMDWFLKGGYTTYSALCCSSRFGRAIVTRLGQYRIVTDALEKCALERAFDSDSLTAAHHSAEFQTEWC